ncbi:kinesin-like protein costa [Cloeon dipterum]|uniref:kinesin-like protein costa n=1 Tax=Cloeon dipterum TaxID=197152 RepID=UPI003220347E
METNIRVAIRVRPPPSDGLLADERIIISTGPQPNILTIENVGPFQFDHVISMEQSQSQTFKETVEPLMHLVFDGYDASVIAFGQPDSGKSYTIFGPEMHCALSETEHGLLQRTSREIFNRISSFPNRKIKVYASFVEIYQEVMRDLLNPDTTNLRIMDDPCMGIKIEGAVYAECQNTADVLHLMMTGLANRQADDCAHAIFTIVINQLIPSTDNKVVQKVSLVTFVDLAAAERLSAGSSVRIDASVAALSSLLRSLSRKSNYEFVPYKVSKLTHILKPSVGGRALTSFLCCVSPLASDTADTITTLNFGELARHVINRPISNSFVREINIASQESETVNLNRNEVKELSENIFGIEFVMGQWRNLLTGAEELFQNLTEGKSVSNEELEQMQRWLCLKQECEEIAESQQTESLSILLQKSLNTLGLSGTSEVKVSENESNSVNNNNRQTPVYDADSDSTDEEMVGNGTHHAKSSTATGTDDEKESRGISTPELNAKVNTLLEQFRSEHNSNVCDVIGMNMTDDEHISPKCSFDFDQLFATDENEPVTVKSSEKRTIVAPNEPELIVEIPASNECGDIVIRSRSARHTPLTDSDMDANTEKKDWDPVKAKHNRLKKVMIELQSLQTRILDLRRVVELKEEMLKDLIAHADLRQSLKAKVLSKYNQALEMVSFCTAKLAQSEKVAASDPRSRHHLEIVETCRELLKQYTEQFEDATTVYRLLDNTPKKAIEFERSLTSSRRQLEKLRKLFIRQEKYKDMLEKEQLMLRTASPQNRPESCGIPLDEDLSTDGSVDTLEANEDFDINEEEDIAVPTPENERDPQWQRKEIHRLRKLKNNVITDLTELRNKLKDTKYLEKEELWNLYKLEEAIDAIDTAIEYKNEIISNINSGSTVNRVWEENEDVLLKRLSGLSLNETKLLLYKYFKKCVDMRDGGRQLAVQLAQQDTHSEILAWKLHKVGIQTEEARDATAKQFLAKEMDHQEQLHKLLATLSESSQQLAEATRAAVATRFDMELRQGDRVIKKKMEDMRLMVHTKGNGGGASSHHLGRSGFPGFDALAAELPLALQLNAHDSTRGKLVPPKRKGRDYQD